MWRCVQFYVLFFIKELPLNQNATSTIKTYLQAKKKLIIKLFFKIFRLDVSEENIFWSAKLCKHPSKARLIIFGPQCSVQPLSKALTAVLKCQMALLFRV